MFLAPWSRGLNPAPSRRRLIGWACWRCRFSGAHGGRALVRCCWRPAVAALGSWRRPRAGRARRERHRQLRRPRQGDGGGQAAARRAQQDREFRTLKITPRVCYTSDPSEPPRTSTFVEVDEILFDGSQKRIFSGWMFAESPGLNPLVHPVFDVWLTGCSQPARAPPPEDARHRPRGGRSARRSAAPTPATPRAALRREPAR